MRPLAHLRSLILPFTALVLVPWAILGSDPALALAPWRLILGGALFAGGLSMLGWTAGLFATVGDGTLAPWEPTRRLVVRGPYRHVRNPMITGVLTAILGEATATGSRGLAGWAAAFFAINHVYFLLSEEPGLVRRFGAPYERYRRSVPRWIPRLTPWTDDTPADADPGR